MLLSSKTRAGKRNRSKKCYAFSLQKSWLRSNLFLLYPENFAVLVAEDQVVIILKNQRFGLPRFANRNAVFFAVEKFVTG
jgi:hypothetical protein